MATANWYRVHHPYENDIRILRTNQDAALQFGQKHIDTVSKGQIVFDIDDTIIMAADDSVFKEVKNLYDSSNLPKAIITARPEQYRSETIGDLNKANVGNYTELHMLSKSHERAGDIGLFKWQKRHKLESKQNDAPVQLNVGDQWTDHMGIANVAETLDDLMQDDKVYIVMPLTSDGRKVMASNLSIKLPSLLDE